MNTVNAKVTEDGAQFEIKRGHDVLVTIRQHPEYGFKGNIVTKDAGGTMKIVEFHGDGIEGVCVHSEEVLGSG